MAIDQASEFQQETTAYLQNSAKDQVSFLNALVDNLSLFGDLGDEQAPFIAQTLLSDYVSTGSRDSHPLIFATSEYLATIKQWISQVEWEKEEYKNHAVRYIGYLTHFVGGPADSRKTLGADNRNVDMMLITHFKRGLKL